MPNLTIYAALAIGFVLSLGGAYEYGHTKGYSAAELTCARADASANAKAITDWKAEADAQRLADRDQATKDAAARDAATAALADIQTRFAGLKLAVVKAAPKGSCTLSPQWVQYFNGATP